MDVLWPLAANVLLVGSLYAVIAGSFSLIYSVTKVQHLAHGGVVVASGYAFYAATAWFGWPPSLAAVLAIAVAVGIGVAMNAWVYERLRRRRTLATAGSLIATFSLLLIAQYLLLALFGSATKTLYAFTGDTHAFGPVVLTDHELRVIALSAAAVAGLLWFLSKTRMGKAVRAVAANEDAAEIVGISARKMRRNAFAIGSALAGLAGILFAIEYSLQPTMATGVTVRMFFRAIVGGVGSVGGAVLGSLLQESAIAGTAYFWNTAWQDVVSFVLTVAILYFRPQGLLMKRNRLV